MSLYTSTTSKKAKNQFIMEILPQLEKWVANCNSSRIAFELARKQLNDTLDKIESIDELNEINDKSWLIQLLESLTYFLFDKVSQPNNKRLISNASKIWGIIEDNHHEHSLSINILIEDLRPHLLRNKNEKVIKQANKNVGLNPKLGLSLKEDNIRDEWYKNNEFKYIGTFHFILTKLQHHDLSGNLWWIIPGILNLMDDTNHFEDVKIPSIELFYQLLECFTKDTSESANKWISIQDSGLYDLFEPPLKNMLYFTPPSFPQEQTLAIWSSVYPVLIKLCELQYNYPPADPHQYNGMLINLANEVILQHSIPRCAFKHEILLLFGLNELIDILKIVGEPSILIFQRIVYVVGETLVSDPFFTLFDSVIDVIIKLIHTLIKICPQERIIAHRFDLIGLIVLITIKCDKEGKLAENTRLNSLQQLIYELNNIGVDTSAIQEQLIKEDSYKDIIIKLFTYKEL